MKEKIKIQHIITHTTSSGDKAYYYVVNRLPEFVYKKISYKSIIGKDEGIFKTYGYDTPSGRFYAFGGRKFDLQLDNGSVEHCFGQWWDIYNDDMKDYIPEDCSHFAYNTIEDLKKCYVFYGGKCDTEWLNKLIEECEDKTEYDYWEYEKAIKI